MEKALQNISRLLGKEVTEQRWRKRFERIQQMPGAIQKFGCIANILNKEQLYDYLTEIKFALIFAGLGFQVEIEPSGKKRPDLRISRDNHSAIVEIKRFRQVYSGPPELSLLDEPSSLKEYGNLQRDIRKAYDNILKKFQQVGNNESIIAFWNDDEDMEEIEVMEAVRDLSKDVARQILSLPKGLSLILYCSNWIRISNQYQLYNPQELYCFPLQVLKPHQANWIKELEDSSVNELIKRALN